MALELMDEHEQGELVRNWLRQNAVAILVGVLAGLALIVGWQQWVAHKRDTSAAAQLGFKAYAEAVDRKDLDAAKKSAADLREKFAGSPYATFAALRQAQEATRSGDGKAAVEALEWARANAPMVQLKELATLRLARAKLGVGAAQEALALVGEVKDEGYKAVVAELRGDALVAMNRASEARTAYDEALTLLDPNSPERNFVEMKRDDLPEGAVAAAPVAPAPAAPAAAAPATPAPAASPAPEGAKS